MLSLSRTLRCFDRWIFGYFRWQVKVEGAKFDQQKEEFMNVDGEAEVDVDIMKELRYVRLHTA